MKRLIFIIGCLLFSYSSYSQKYVYIFLKTNPDKVELTKHKIDSLQEGHLANIQKLAKEDKLLVAGPFEGGGGIFIMNTASTNEAIEWISNDPAIAANRYKVESLPWTPRVNDVCLVDTSATFVNYTFVRYNTFITKFNVQQAPEYFAAHDRYIHEIVKAGNVISEGVFDNGDGGIIILKGTVEQEVFQLDPAVKNGIIQPEIKKIWVGKGSFCEK